MRAIGKPSIFMAQALGICLAVTTQAALVGHWEFDESSGTTAVDSSGNGYDGTVANPVWTNGVIGGALAMNGTDCQVSGFASELFSMVSNELTISFWCEGDVDNLQNMNGFSGYRDGVRTLNNHLPNGTVVFFDANSITNVFRDRISLDLGNDEAFLLGGKWNHWAFTKSATNGYMAVYANGDLLFDGTNLVDHMAGVTNFFIGSDGGGSRFYRGLMDDFRVYDNELSAAEVSNLYAAVTLPDYAIASISASSEAGAIPLEVVFNGSNSISSGSITNYFWDFGDGNTGSGIVVTNIYTETGTYTAVLTVSDDNGHSDAGQVDIEATPPVAEINWGTAQTIAGDADVSTNGTVVWAYSFVGTGAGSTTTVNTVRFIGLERYTVNPDISHGFDRDTDSYADGVAGTPYRNLSAEYQAILAGGIYRTGDSITLLQLTEGQEYEVQLWVNDSRDDGFGRSSSIQGSMVTLDYNVSEEVGGVGQYVMGTFTADGNLQQTISFIGSNLQLNAMQLRDVSVLSPDQPTLVYEGSSLAWNANGEFLYSVQSNLNLSMGNGWGTFTNVVGTPPVTTVNLPPQNKAAEFYRIIVE